MQEKLTRVVREPVAPVSWAGEELGRSLVAVFREAAGSVPRYRRLLEARGVAPEEVRDLSAFTALVPVIGPDDGLPLSGLGDSCPEGSTAGVGEIAYEVDPLGKVRFWGRAERDRRLAAEQADRLWAALYGADRRRTLVISCQGEGMALPTSMARVQVGPRGDVLAMVLKRVAGGFEQALLIGPPEQLRVLLIEAYPGAHLPESFRMVAVCSDRWFPVGLQDAVASLLGPEVSGQVGAVAALPMSSTAVFADPGLLELRRVLAADPALAREVIPGEWPVLPVLYQFDPSRIWIEELQVGEGPRLLAATRLDRAPYSPVIRYCGGDVGRVFGFEEFSGRLAAAGLESAIPDRPLPILAHAGQQPGGEPSIEQVREALASCPEVYLLTTGLVTVQHFRPAKIQLHLRKGVRATQTLRLQFSRGLGRALKRQVTVTVSEYTEALETMTLDLRYLP
jgi:hypothetical protein